MKQLPQDAKSYKRTPVFTEAIVPAGLIGKHDTAANVWAVIHVLEGSLVYRILAPAVEEYHLDPQNPGIVEPRIPHQVELIGPVRFQVEFYRLD